MDNKTGGTHPNLLMWFFYAKARAGLMRGVTGVDDPYVPPSNPELTIDTTNLSPTEAAQEVLLYLEEQGYIK